MAGSVIISALAADAAFRATVLLLWFGCSASAQDAPDLPVIQLPPVSNRGQTGEQSYICPARNSCNAADVTDFYFRNCFCDDHCSMYDDCCEDYTKPPGATTHDLDPATVSCDRFEQIDLQAEIYMVNTCPATYADDYVKQHCEDAPSDDVFYTLPVSGATSSVLYRNYYCALCGGEIDTTFWQPTVECNTYHEQNVTESFLHDALTLRIPGCWLRYTHPRAVPRRCKYNVGRCPKDWVDKKVRKKCRKTTAYVYVNDATSRFVFKNEHCAECNMVNDTYLTCRDPRTPPVTPPGEAATQKPRELVPFSILLDLNSGRGKQYGKKVGSDGTVERAQSEIRMKQCADNKVYDPFARVCRTLYCTEGFQFVEGHCVRNTGVATTTLTPASTETVRTTQETKKRTTTPEDVRETGREEIHLPVSIARTIPGSPQPTTPRMHDPERETLNEDCPKVRLNQSEFRILDNSSIYVPNMKLVYDAEDYVADGHGVLICAPSVEQNYTMVENVTYSVIMFRFNRIQSLVSLVGSLISLMALFIHFVVYIMLPPLRNVPGKCILSLVVALFCAQLLLVGGVQRFEHETLCMALAASTHYFFLVAFFWMNVLAVDMWRTFSTPSLQTSDEETSRPFVLYSLYAWLGPALIVCGSLALDLLTVHELYRPHYGEGLCWITSRYGLVFLFALPLGLLLLVNGVVFVATVRRICLVTKESQGLTHDKQKSRFLLYVKLSVIMGLTWVFGFLAALTDVHALWYVFILLNALQGLFICLAFVCTRKVFRLLRDRGRVHRTPATANGRYAAHSCRGGPSDLDYRHRAYIFDGEPKVIISQETSI